MPIVQMTAIVPDKEFNPKVFEREVRRALEAEVRELDKLYKMVSRSWDGEKPNMAKDVVVDETDAYGEVYTADDSRGNEKLMWLDEGTGPRDIPARNKPMKFQVGYSPRTRRGLLSSGGYKRFGEWRSTYLVHNHEIHARKFTDTIIRVRGKRFQAAISNAFDRAADKF